MDVLVDICGLSKHFGSITAVDAVDLAVSRGEVLGFLGPNGAGKTTTMRMVTGFLPPDAGTARVCGHDVVTDPLEVKRRVGYLPEGAPLYGEMTCAAFLRYMAAMRGLGGRRLRACVGEAAERLHLHDVWQQPIETLSNGFRRRVGLAQALLHDPDVLILDEPTDGLDPNQKREVRALLRDMAGGKAIIISTHILEEVEAVCTRAAVISAGRLVADATPAALLARSRYHNAVAIRVPADVAERAAVALRPVQGLAGVECVGEPGGTVRIIALPSDTRPPLDRVLGAAEHAGIPVVEIAVERGRLDDVFSDLTQGAP